MKTSKDTSFLKGTLALSISVIITKVIGVAFKVPLSYLLGDSGMGYFNTAYAIYGFFYILCTAGVPKAMTLVLRGHDADEKGNGNSLYILTSALRLFGTIGLIATLINIIFAPALVGFIGNKKALLSILAISPSILFVSLSGALRGYLNSYEKLVNIAVSQLIEGGIKLVIGLLFAYFGITKNMPVNVISALAILGITLGTAISFLYMLISVYCSKSISKAKQNTIFATRKISKEILKIALPIALCSSLLNLSSTLDLAIIIKRLIKSGYSEIYANSLYGNYTTLAIPMFTLVISVLAPLATSYMPRLSSSAARGKDVDFRAELNKLLTVTVLISVPASLAFFFYSFDLLDVLFSVQSSAVGADMLIFLSMGVCLLTVLTVINTALESRGQIGITVFSLLLGALTKITISYLLIGRAGVGILGAPLGTVISYAVSLLVSLLALELSGVKTRTMAILLVAYLVGIISFYPPYKLVYSTGLGKQSFLSMMLALSVSGLVYGVIMLAIHILVCKKRMFNLHKKDDC